MSGHRAATVVAQLGRVLDQAESEAAVVSADLSKTEFADIVKNLGPAPDCGEVCALMCRRSLVKHLEQRGYRVTLKLGNFKQKSVEQLRRWLRVEEDSAPPRAPPLPSEAFEQVRAACSYFRIGGGALDEISEVADHRHRFFDDAAQALGQISTSGVPDGGLMKFFQQRGLQFASTGGLTATVVLERDGKEVKRLQTNFHLKQGDSTTRTAAVRIYFYAWPEDKNTWMLILYAGPHIDGSRTVRVSLDTPP